jgi:aldose 1-epimerase
MTQMNNYAARQMEDRGVPIVRLSDAAHGIEVSIVPSLGNRAIGMLVRGQNILYVPFDDPSLLKTEGHTNGIPFLAPWANRMPEGFWANGKRYAFQTGSNQAGSKVIRADQNGIPIHGMLTASPLWEVIDCAATETAAHVTSRLEFWKYPDLMANWPFAHEYRMTYRLAEGTLEVSITVTNLSAEPMPLALGFHPYFQLPGVAIAEAFAHIPVRLHVETDSRLIPTGETRPVNFGDRVSLRDHRFDDGFTGLVRDSDGRAVFCVEAGGKKIEVAFGPKYPVAIVYAPPGHNYICFEPMSAITNGINLAHEGKYRDLQFVDPGGEWQESFWVRRAGF